ncbi:hypothetical protein CI109_103627 [Kwoniella shandongensis]|uniref:Uncharacterized protein n=1 Tax=Kwoniella shandongensis TaxID=1734106 RepID=A0A5M6CDB5_9TREE|nr:uncharacterized protein CI109_000681 [Kwoniella shandongensis]KAA5531109.1 hypothetical protein CI109_000681 [Kwoniella shandongensis]
MSAHLPPQPSDSYIQLGSLTLHLATALPSFSRPAWTQLTPSFLSSTNLFDPDSLSLISILSDALRDRTLDLEGEWIRMRGKEVRVRCKISANGGGGGMGKKAKGKGREGLVKRLLQVLYKDWEENEAHGNRLLGLTEEDQQTMQDIYASVPSPPDPEFFGYESTSPQDAELYDGLENYENPKGVKTFLYRYQIRSVAKMLQMETKPNKLVDPLFTPFQEAGREGIYYVNLLTWDIQRHPGWYDLPRGGILCEQMGTGKTLMCLALIVSTLHQPTAPPPTEIDISEITTDIAERTYPFAPHSDLRELAGFPRRSTQLIFPSLVELCANKLAILDPSAINNRYLPAYTKPLLNRRTFYYTLPLDDECSRTAKRQTFEQTVRKMYLAKGTLVIVPQILVQQWKEEITNHLEEGVLNVYEVKGHLPPIEDLLGYDVILMDVNRFGFEETERRKFPEKGPSVLLQARWKRIILDEGHVASNKTSNAMILAMQLSVERRWLVSGTPTRYLQQGGEIEMEGMGLSAVSRPSTPSLESGGGVIHHATTRRTWSKRDIEDATRIGVMIGGFLAAEPFKSEALFQRLVTASLSKRGGPEFGAVARMKYIANGLMVKHGPKVIDMEAQLPPSTISKELLQFDPMQRITYNVLAALVSSNVLTSGGEDADYFLHPKNVESYNQVVNNLHLACFWYSARAMDADGCLERTRSWLDRHPEASEHIRTHLEEACRHLETALSTPGWDEWMTNAVSMAMDGTSFPSIIKQAWSDSFNGQPNMIDMHSLIELRELNKRGSTLQELHIAGWDFRSSKSEISVEEMLRTHEKHTKAEHKAKKAEERKVKKGAATAAQTPKAAPISPGKRATKRKSDVLEERLDEAARNANKAAGRTPLSPPGVDLPRPLPALIHTKSRSAKVNYVLRSIQESDKEDKFVIFGDTYELGHLTEGLDMVDITSTFVGHSINGAQRIKALERFNKPEVKVILLDLTIAARGLNLVIANRMIFLAPVWNLDVQAQAIKRVHRIGQTRATRVEILVTEGTFEEDIAKRSTTSRSADEEKLYTRAMIENPRFVYPEKEESHTFAVRFTPLGETITPESSNVATPDEVLPITPTGKQRDRGITFVEPTSPTLERDDDTLCDGPGEQERDHFESGDGEETRPPKKKARVAFV